ncbi:hypothetical protein D3C87_527480 [compost metagenome]|uniref:DUF2000 domain-containing protein n=1 Tax=Variovorax boronicumulans TaxID=436515 RepID=UPI000BB307C7|nr:DUF2000 domain-containing protein [Variovorax boronicumulans]
MPEEKVSSVLDKVVIVLSAGLMPGPAANIASCIAAGLAASSANQTGRSLVDATGLKSVAPSHLPIAILRAESVAMSTLMKQLAGGAVMDGGILSLFPAYAQAIHEWGEYRHRHSQSAHADELMLGIGLAGPKRWVNRMTGSLPLWC